MTNDDDASKPSAEAISHYTS